MSDTIRKLRIKQGIDMFKLRERRRRRPHGIGFDEIEESMQKFLEQKQQTEKQFKELDNLANQIPEHRQMKKRIAKRMLIKKVKKVFC